MRSYLHALSIVVLATIPVCSLAQEVLSLPIPAGGDEAAVQPPLEDYAPDAMAARDAESIVAEHAYAGPDYSNCDCDTQLFESTGTWLRRGFWYAEVDAVVMNRFWQRDSFLLAGDANSLQTGNVFGRGLYLDGKVPGAEGSVRLALGRFLFRDTRNRDHQIEFNVFGGGEYLDDCNVQSVTPNGLFVSSAFSRFNTAFDNSSAMEIDYASRFNSFELNYRVRGRMKRDRMELDPTGTWRRVARPQVTKHFVTGIRWFDLSETIDWSATDVLVAGVNEQGQYDIETSNDMIGFQLGGGAVWDATRWSIDVGGKAGVYVNSINAESQFIITNSNGTDFASSADDFGLSFVGEYQMIARWHLRPNLSLRAGWQMMYVTGVALAPHNVTFAPLGGKVTSTGDPFYHGALFGFEGYW